MTAALAHEEVPVGDPGGYYRSVLVRVPEGLAATLLGGRIPAVSLTSDRAVVVFGEEGEEMARLGGGRIEVNDASATWRVTATARGEPASTGWRAINDAQLTWLEPRARPVTTSRTTRSWRVPVSVDGAPAALTGETRWVAPQSATPTSPTRLYVIVGVGIATLALAVMQRWRGARRGVSQRER